MSLKRVSVSRTLDDLQAWGDQPVVNPVKLVDGRLPEVVEQRWDQPRWSVPLALLAVAMLAAILVAWFTASTGGPGFIYENF
jgi:hypothetical protein